MERPNDRIFKGVFILMLGLFIDLYLFFSLLDFNYQGTWIYVLAITLFCAIVLDGILWIVSGLNRKKHAKYISSDSNFNLEEIQKLDRHIVILDKLLKLIPNSYIVFAAVVIFVEYGFNFYTILIILYFAFIYWKH